jgi:hypothetical protein
VREWVPGKPIEKSGSFMIFPFFVAPSSLLPGYLTRFDGGSSLSSTVGDPVSKSKDSALQVGALANSSSRAGNGEDSR